MTDRKLGNPDNLRRAAAAKREAATRRADQALRQLVKTGDRITFEGVAAAAGVSKDFLYRSPTLRPRIEQLRGQQDQVPPATGDKPGRAVAAAEPTSSIIRTLTLKLSQERASHRRDVTELKAALAAAHGELLTLRRQQAGQA